MGRPSRKAKTVDAGISLQISSFSGRSNAVSKKKVENVARRSGGIGGELV